MHRIDGPGALPGGHFTEGDPTVGTVATIVTMSWAEAVQEEIAGVIEGADMALAKPNNAQLLAAVRKLIDLAVPVGTVQWGYFAAAEPGSLLMLGQELNRADYPRLYAAMVARGFVVEESAWSAGQRGMFSHGNGTTTFRMPLVGGRFPRIVDDGVGLDPGRTVGSLQADEFRAHTHDMGSESGGGGNHNTPVDSGGVDEQLTGNPTRSAGGAETRPVNIAWRAMIRF
jgi:hypothetical protein